MVAQTTNRNLPLPAGSDPIIEGDDAIRTLSNSLDSAATLITGVFSSRPATAPSGTFFLASDTSVLYVLAGGSWLEVAAQPLLGSILPYAGLAAPADPRWIECNGQAVSRATYAKLYALLGGTNSPYGAGNGSTTFNVPDLRGRVPIGVGTGTGLSPRNVGDLGGEERSIAPLPDHKHDVTDLGHNHGGATYAGQADRPYPAYGRTIPNATFALQPYAGLTAMDSLGSPADGSHVHGIPNGPSNITIRNAGSGNGSHNNVQPYLGLRFIIRAL